MQPDAVKTTYADTSALDTWAGFKPSTPLQVGVVRFVNWYRQYYQL